MKKTIKDIDEIIAAWVRLADEQGATESGNHRYTGVTFPAAFPVITAGEVKARLGRQWKHMAANLLALAERVESWSPTDTARGLCREFYLSSLDADLVAALGAQPTVSRTIAKAVEVGMLIETRAAYCHHAANARPKAYIYNPGAAAMLAAVMAAAPVKMNTIKGQRMEDGGAKMNTIKGQPQIFDGGAKMNTNRDIERDKTFSPLEDIGEISKDCQNLGLARGFQGASKAFKDCHDIDADKGLDGAFQGLQGAGVDNLPSGGGKGQQGGILGLPGGWKFATHINRAATDAEILNALAVSYPWLPEYQARAARLNEALPPIFKMTFAPKIKRGKGGKVSKVGIRCHSPFCSTLRGEFRKAVLRDLGFSSVYEYDTKSSIYRITYLLNTGRWIDNAVDFYRLMLPRESYLSRDTYKSLAQRLYFCHSPAEVFNALRPRPVDPQGLLDRQTMARAARLQYGKDTEAAIRARLAVYWQAMRGIVTPYRSEIFFHESCIYLDLLEALTARGYRVGQVYDGFYSDRPDIEAACLALLPSIAQNYLAKSRMKTRPEPLAMKMALEAPENPANAPAPASVESTPAEPCKGQETPANAVDTPAPAREDKGQQDTAQGVDEFLTRIFGPDTPQEAPAPPSTITPQAVETLLDSLPAWLDGVEDTPRPIKHDRKLGLTLDDLLETPPARV